MDFLDLAEMANSVDDQEPAPPPPPPPPEPVLSKPPKRTWTEQQLAIIKEFQNPKSGNIVVVARAGSAKTSTSIEGGKWAPERQIIYAAFGKAIALELNSRLPNNNCRAMTIHSLGCRIIGEHRDYIVDNNSKWIRVEQEITNWIAGHEWDVEAGKFLRHECWLIVKLTELVKQMAPYTDTIAEVLDVADKMNLANICPDRETRPRDFYPPRDIPELMELVCQIVVNTLESLCEEAFKPKCSGKLMIDFNDMLFLPVRCGWLQKRYPLIVVDEAADLSFTQLEICMGMCKGRMIVVGDNFQAVYGWRGADSGAMERMTKILGAKVMGLTTSFRCPRAVVKEANKYVEDFYAWEHAKEGRLEHIDYMEMINLAQPGDFVLSRKNAPLMGICLKLIARNKKAMMAGNDIGMKMLRLLENIEGNDRFKDCHDLWNRLKTWAVKEKETIKEIVEKRFAKAKPERIKKEIQTRWELVSDELGMISHMIHELQCPRKIKNRLTTLFERDEGDRGAPDRSKYIFCSSVHAAKGLETPRVFVLADTLRDYDQEERNIAYVAITRSMDELYMCYRKTEDVLRAEEESIHGYKHEDDDDSGYR